MRRYTAAGVLLSLSLTVACTEAAESTVDETWAQEAEEVVALLADAYDRGDPYQAARFYTAGGTLDMTAWGYGVATTPDEVVTIVRNLWFAQPGWQVIRADHLFVSPDSALVWWSAYNEDGGSEWIQTYFFGKGGQTASRVFSLWFVPEDDREVSQRYRELAQRYARAWEDRDTAALKALYSPNVVALNQTTGEEWRSADDLLATVDGGPPVQPGPGPGPFFYRSGNSVEAVVFVQLGGECPMLEARRLIFAGEAIVKETRFTHVPSAQRCMSDLPDGWWSTFELPTDLQNNVTEVVDAGGSLVELVNAEPIHEEFTRWMFDRYVEAGIGLPEIAAVWFPPAPECDELGGLAIESDERYAGRHTVVICFDEDRLTWDDSASGWFPTAAAYGLHELAHVWMLDRLTDDVRAAYNEMAGLTVWRGADAEWAQRGVEWAAFTIPWAITGAEDAVWPIFFERSTCEELADRYRLLTQQEPTTTCGEDGWS